MPSVNSPYFLPDHPDVSNNILDIVRSDYERFSISGLPNPLEPYLIDQYQLDVTAEYAGFALKNPWGKASGQLSMTARQVEEDVAAGLSFVVLKTVIAQDETGQQMMEEWAIKEARMLAEPIVGQSGEQGWTISWKGRGWWLSFDEYLQLIRDAQKIAQDSGTLIVPSCKYHLPTPDENSWKVSEYDYTSKQILQAWREAAGSPEQPMPFEKDFSPTLAGSDRSSAQANILQWLEKVPELIRAAIGQKNVQLGLKIFNALFDDEFQLEMLRSIHTAGENCPDFFIYGNRLFDPNREFDGKQGIAYGGPDLSDRNLSVMTTFQKELDRSDIKQSQLPWSATGNITTGKMAIEYALRGASSFQLHTFFQLPANQYSMTTGSKTEKALHELYFHPQSGFIVWMYHLAKARKLPTNPIRFQDIFIE